MIFSPKLPGNEQVKADIARARKTITELQHEKERYKGTVAEEKRIFETTIDAKIRQWEEDISRMETEIRKSYMNALEMQLQIINKFENFKLGIDEKTYRFMITQLNQVLYGKTEELNWDVVSPMMPDRLERNILKAYPCLNTTEIRICILYLLEQTPETIARILSLNLKSLYTINSSIKKKQASARWKKPPTGSFLSCIRKKDLTGSIRDCV